MGRKCVVQRLVKSHQEANKCTDRLLLGVNLRIRGPPPPVATGKASLLHYFSSSPSVRADSVSSSSSPARARPSRANSLPHADAGSSIGRSKSVDQATPRAPLRATQSLGSLEATLHGSMAGDGAAVPRRITASSSSSSSGALPQRLGMAAGAHRRSPRLRLTPTVEESEEEQRRQASVKAESPTPRRNPPRSTSRRSSPALSPIPANFAADPERPRVPGSASTGKGKGKAPEIFMSDSDLETHVKKENRGGTGLLSLCTPSPAKRARRYKPKRILAFTIDEQGRDVLDLTSSSPSAASIATLSSDSDSEIIVVPSRRPSRTPTTAPNQPLSPIRRMKQDVSLPRSGVGSTSPQKTPRRTQAIATERGATPNLNGTSPWSLRSNGAPAPFIPANGTGQESATPTRSGVGDRVHDAEDGLSPIPPRSTAGTVPPSTAVSATLASISPSQLGTQEFVAPEPSTPLRPPASTMPASSLARRTHDRPAAAGEGRYGSGCLPQAGVPLPTASVPSTSLSRLTDSAVRRLSAHVPVGSGVSGSMFVRSPSGSPLSSLAPTPNRPASPTPYRAQASPSRTAVSTKRVHSFELIIDLPRPASTSKKLKLDRGGSNAKAKVPGRKVPTSVRSARTKAPDRDRSEWDALMEERSNAEEADGEDSEREASPSPAKARKSEPKNLGPASSEAESVESGDDSNSDEEELATFLNRARARREAGATLTSANGTSPSAATVLTTVSPPAPATSTRRSNRARPESDHSAPARGAKPAGSPRRAGAGKNAPSLFTGQPETRDGRDTFNRMMRDRKKEQEKGHTTEWYDKWKRALQRDGDDDVMVCRLFVYRNLRKRVLIPAS